MLHAKSLRASVTVALLLALGSIAASAQQIKTVFVIAMENHNWTQPANQFTGGIQQIYQNPNAPFINSLVDGTAFAVVNGSVQHISEQVSYATAYHNVLATVSGNNAHIHPSEPNYIWAEAGSNLGVLNDRDPYGPGGPTNQNTSAHLAALLANGGKTWRSYQEDIDLVSVPDQLTNLPLPAADQLTNVVLSPDQWTVPLSSFAGTFASGNFNAFTNATRFNYAPKHNPPLFFTDTNGGNDLSKGNPLSHQYAPLQQFFTDLSNNTVADYNWITPDQFNDMHTTLAAGYKGLTGDPAKIRQGDDFLGQIIPVIMGSDAYKNHGAIIIWFDESEGDGVANDNADDFNHTIGEIVISSRAHKNVDGIPYASPLNFTHSSDLRTMQEIFHVGPFLGDAANATDLSDLFDAGAIPKKP